jgi:hypothetical protein
MRIAFFMFVILLVGGPSLAADPRDLKGFGLSSLVPVEDHVGLEIRGLAANAYSNAMFGARAFGIDPNSGATFNATVSNYSRSAQEASSNGDNGLVNASAFAFGGFGGDEGGLSFTGETGNSGFSFELFGSGAAGGTGITLDNLFGGELQFGFTTGGFSIGGFTAPPIVDP